jgi:hypothetical protein
MAARNSNSTIHNLNGTVRSARGLDICEMNDHLTKVLNEGTQTVMSSFQSILPSPDTKRHNKAKLLQVRIDGILNEIAKLTALVGPVPNPNDEFAIHLVKSKTLLLELYKERDVLDNLDGRQLFGV